jgi:four helix bundle protein
MTNNKEWKKLFLERLLKFSVRIILMANKLPKTPAGFAIANQIIRSGTSVGANVEEAQDASSTKDFIQKLSISLREAKETRYWLKVVIEAKLLDNSGVEKELNECEQLIAMLISSIKSSKARSI